MACSASDAMQKHTGVTLLAIESDRQAFGHLQPASVADELNLYWGLNRSACIVDASGGYVRRLRTIRPGRITTDCLL